MVKTVTKFQQTMEKNKKKKEEFVPPTPREKLAIDRAGRQGAQQEVSFIEKDKGTFPVPLKETQELQERGKVVETTPRVFRDARTVELEQQRQDEIQEGSLVDIPVARETADAGLDQFQDINQFQERSLFGKLESNPLGQARRGQVALAGIKNKEEFDSIKTMTDYMLENGLTPQQVTSDPQLQAILSLQLNDNDLKLLKSGKADVSNLSFLVEGLPLIGDFARKKGGAGIIPTVPSKRADDTIAKITQVGNTIRDYRMAAARNPTKADEYLSLIEDAEIEIRDAESQWKLFIIQSPILQNSPEAVETDQAVINRALNRIGDAKNAIIGGETLEQAVLANQQSA